MHFQFPSLLRKHHMAMRYCRAATAVCSTILSLGMLLARETPAWAQQASDNAPLIPPATVKVERKKLSSTVTLKGVIESDSTTEISVRLKGAAGPLTVEQAVEHGSRVKKGDLLLKLDAEKLTEAVESAREERQLARLAIQLAELDLPILKQQLPLDLAAAERESKQTADDLDRFLKVEKPRQIEETKFSLKSSEFNVESSRDELTQLEKMYRDKDLTEETEQTILKRYKFNLESSEHFLAGTRQRTERALSTDIPRREEAIQLAAAKAALAWQKAREQLPLQLRQKELALEKLKLDDRRAREKLADLEHDLAQMTVTAPTDGTVYHGRAVQGQWSTPAATAYLKGGTLSANDVVLTIVSSGPLWVHTEADEKEVSALQANQTARISLTRLPHQKFDGRVHGVTAIPRGGKFGVRISLTGNLPESIVPGLTASARVLTAQNDTALVVPSSAVFEDPETETSFVYLPGPKPQKKTVKVGMVVGDQTEIVEGLAAGDEILAVKP